MRNAKARAHAVTPAQVQKTDEQWRAELTPEQYRVLRQAHTERPFTGEYVHNHEDGTYRCAGCGAELFRSDAKFESGTGWPSFTEPAVAAAVDCGRTTACSCAAPRCSAAAAAVTWVTCSTTGRGRPASGTASTPARCRSREAGPAAPAGDEG